MASSRAGSESLRPEDGTPMGSPGKQIQFWGPAPPRGGDPAPRQLYRPGKTLGCPPGALSGRVAGNGLFRLQNGYDPNRDTIDGARGVQAAVEGVANDSIPKGLWKHHPAILAYPDLGIIPARALPVGQDAAFDFSVSPVHGPMARPLTRVVAARIRDPTQGRPGAPP